MLLIWQLAHRTYSLRNSSRAGLFESARDQCLGPRVQLCLRVRGGIGVITPGGEVIDLGAVNGGVRLTGSPRALHYSAACSTDEGPATPGARGQDRPRLLVAVSGPKVQSERMCTRFCGAFGSCVAVVRTHTHTHARACG